MCRPIKFIIIIILFILPVIAHAASDLELQAEQVQATYEGAEDISTDFTQSTFVKVLDKTVTKRGKMYFKKGGKFRIEYDGKGEKRYVSDGKLLWVFVPGDEASMITYEVNDETVPREAMTFLNGFKKLKRDFKIAPSKVFTDLQSGEAAFYLTPKSKKAHFKALDAKFNLRSLLEDLQVMNKSGNVSDYHFTNIKTSTGLPDSLFTHGSGKSTPDTLPMR